MAGANDEGEDTHAALESQEGAGVGGGGRRCCWLLLLGLLRSCLRSRLGLLVVVLLVCTSLRCVTGGLGRVAVGGVSTTLRVLSAAGVLQATDTHLRIHA
jgi:hypothetical protein